MEKLASIHITGSHPNPKRELGRTGYQLLPRSRFGLRWRRLSWLYIALSLFLLPFPFAYAATEELIDRPMLHWQNGDALPGSIASATDDTLKWTADGFAEPLDLRRSHLQMIRFPYSSKQNDDLEQPTQIIETHDGNRFFGKVTASDEQNLSIETKLFGPLKLKRSAIHLIANPIERAHVFSGPKGLRGWSTLTYGRKLSEWKEISSGRLRTTMVAAELFRTLPAKGSVDLDIELLWRNNPSFQIRFLTPFATPTKETIKVETRVSGYVLQSLGSNGRFRQLDVIPKGVSKCHLLLRWNHKASELSVFRDRKYVGKVEVDRAMATGKKAGTGSGNAGFYLKNTGPQLTLSRLEVRASSSLDIRYTDPSKDTVLLADNKSVSGIVQSIDGNNLSITSSVEPEEDAKQIPWSNIAEIVFHQRQDADTTAKSKPDDKSPIDCVFRNGETLKGQMLLADDRSLSLKVPAINRPVTCKYKELERVLFGGRTVPVKKGEPYLEIGKRKIHGQLTAAPNSKLGWLPIGGVTASELAANFDARLYLRETESSSVGGPQDDLIYLRNGDVLPCRVSRVVPESMTIESKLVEATSVDADLLYAVELSVDEVPPLKGFDERWDIHESKDNDAAKGEKITVDRDRVHFRGSGSVDRESILYGCDRIAFDLKHRVDEGGIFLHLGLKGDDAVKDQAIPFYFMGEKLFVLGSKRNAYIPCEEETGLYRVVVETHDPFQVTVNGKKVYSVPRNENGGPWSGIAFDVSDGPLFGPPLRKKKKVIDIAVRNLVISQTKRASIRQSTGGVQSAPLLTIPRHRKSDSITHIAIGSNSDAIRGTLVELSDDYLRMLSKDEELNLPRESLSGLVWLAPEEPPGQQQPELTNTSTRVVLKDTTTLSISDITVSGKELAGNHVSLGRCKVPLADVHLILRGNTENPFHRHEFLDWKTKRSKQPDFATAESDGHRLQSPLVGKPLNITAEMLETRESVDLSQYHGKVLVLDFWASWCAPCIRNMPAMIDTIESFPETKVQLLAVNQGEDRSTVMSVVESKQWNLNVATDLNGSATRELRIEALPQTVVVNQQGKVSAVFIGASRRLHAEVKAEIKKLLGEQP